MEAKKQVFRIIVWFRYASHGEVEKDFEVHQIKADNIQDAINKASDLYRSLKAIPFNFIYKNKEYKPDSLTKLQMFNLTKPNYASRG